MSYIVNLKDVNLTHLNEVGGKNASIGEMIQNLSGEDICSPGGFAVTSEAYKHFLLQNNLNKKIAKSLSSKITKIEKLNQASLEIRRWILATPFLESFGK